MENPSYHRNEPVVVTERMRRQIAGAVAELDLAQIAVSRQLTPAERTAQALSMIAAAQRIAAMHLHAARPDLTPDDALRIVRTIGIVEYERRRRQATAHL